MRGTGTNIHYYGRGRCVFLRRKIRKQEAEQGSGGVVAHFATVLDFTGDEKQPLLHTYGSAVSTAPNL